jgi:hypothetical protein
MEVSTDTALLLCAEPIFSIYFDDAEQLHKLLASFQLQVTGWI